MAKTKAVLLLGFFLSFFICFNAASQYFANIITATLLDIMLQVFDEGNKAAKSSHIRPFACNVMADSILPEFFPVAINWELIPDSIKPLVFYNCNIKSATPYNCII